jgi:hypothetical protein
MLSLFWMPTEYVDRFGLVVFNLYIVIHFDVLLEKLAGLRHCRVRAYIPTTSAYEFWNLDVWAPDLKPVKRHGSLNSCRNCREPRTLLEQP